MGSESEIPGIENVEIVPEGLVNRLVLTVEEMVARKLQVVAVCAIDDEGHPGFLGVLNGEEGYALLTPPEVVHFIRTVADAMERSDDALHEVWRTAKGEDY